MIEQFKGTAGEWEVTPDEQFSDTFTLHPTPTYEESDVNAKLMAGSKKLLFALDDLVDALCGEQEAEDEIEKAFGKIISPKIFAAKRALKSVL